MKFITMLCPVHKENTPSFMYNKKNGDFYCFGCGFKGNLFELHQKMALSQEIIDYLYLHIDEWTTNKGHAEIVKECMKYNPMLCDVCWIPALLDRGKRVQCQNCGKEEEEFTCSDEDRNNFRRYVERHYANYLRPFDKHNKKPS
ncbi:MAG: zinc finger protein [Pseudomonadota bacterium]